MDRGHLPVLLTETIKYLNPKDGGRYLDGTVGAGGHSQQILIASEPNGQVVGLDRDSQAVKNLADITSDRFHVFHASYEQAPEYLDQLDWQKVDGILLDLGLSSNQLDNPERGMSFREDGSLDARFNQLEGDTAAELLNTWPASKIAEVLAEYGELRRTRQLADQIIAYRHDHQIKTTTDLIEATGLKAPRRLAQLFQAIRIATNDELGTLERSLPKIWDRLESGGRMAIITFHSLEDRIVKNQFRTWAQAGLGSLVLKKPLTASYEETKRNPRSRSAKLRVIEKN